MAGLEIKIMKWKRLVLGLAVGLPCVLAVVITVAVGDKDEGRGIAGEVSVLGVAEGAREGGERSGPGGGKGIGARRGVEVFETAEAAAGDVHLENRDDERILRSDFRLGRPFLGVYGKGGVRELTAALAGGLPEKQRNEWLRSCLRLVGDEEAGDTIRGVCTDAAESSSRRKLYCTKSMSDRSDCDMRYAFALCQGRVAETVWNLTEDMELKGDAQGLWMDTMQWCRAIDTGRGGRQTGAGWYDPNKVPIPKLRRWKKEEGE